MRFRRSTIVPATVAVALLASLSAFRTYSGNPRWPLANGFHYVAELNTVSFPPNSVWDQNAQYSLADWRDIGSTGFSPGFRRGSANAFVNTDGINTWMWSSQPAQNWLGITYYRFNGPSLLESDIVYNTRYAWTNGLVDPCKDRPYSPFDFRGVARHEVGHAIGFDHESTWCGVMNPTYERGTAIPHTGASGEMPHADDKFACRFLYPHVTPSTVYNLMATSWRPGSGQVQRLSVSGSYPAGAKITVPFYVQNQTNLSFPATQRVGFYLSTDDTISTFDMRFADTGFAGSWSAYGEQLYTPTVTIPPSTPVGSYHVGVILDWDNRLSERYEGDNVARLGVIAVTGAPTPPDLIVENLQASTTQPARGDLVTFTGSVRNLGTTGTSTAIDTVISLTSHGGDPADGWVLHYATQASVPGKSAVPFTIKAQIPDTICAERTWYARATTDWADAVKESNENNNWQQVSIVPKWEKGSGFRLAALRKFVDSTTDGTFAMCAKSLDANTPANAWHLVVWTCSGTKPGIPWAPFGTLPLNIDACTDFGLAVNGLYINAIAPLSSSPQGSTVELKGGAWLAPIKNVETHFAALFFDAKTVAFIGLGPVAVSCTVN